jgi:RHH-type rel operon transcriptional repressor/antitoxin RelB
MAMLTLRIDDKLNDRITALAQKTGRTKTYFIKKLLVEAIDDLEDELWAQQAARELLAKRARGEVEESFDWIEMMEALKKRDLEDNS